MGIPIKPMGIRPSLIAVSSDGLILDIGIYFYMHRERSTVS